MLTEHSTSFEYKKDGGLDVPLFDPKPSDRTVEADISEELLKLSLFDRSAVEEEVHGVRCMAVQETPKLVTDGLREFDAELIRIKRERERVNHSQRRPEERESFGNVLRNVLEPEEKDDYIYFSCCKNKYEEIRMQHNNCQHPAHPKKKSDCYLNDPSVRLRFLRCECFDVKKAVDRFVSYLDFTQLLFGDFIAHRPCRYSDFQNDFDNTCNHNKDELKSLLQSRLTYLPFRDRAGRRICCAVGHSNFKVDPALRLKIIMYMDWIVSEDIETQQKGIVIIAWPSGEEVPCAPDKESERDNIECDANANESQGEDIWERYIRPSLSKRDIWFQKRGFESTPLRIASIHFCAKDTSLYHIISSFYYFGLNQDHKKRYKAQFGNQIEILYKLQQYGIPAHLLPLTHTGAVKTNVHAQWMKSQKRIEDQREKILLQRKNSFNGEVQSISKVGKLVFSTSETDSRNEEGKAEPKVWVECPRSYDVIFRRGNTYSQLHLGNLNYKNLIEKVMEEHFAAKKRQEKIDLTWRVVNEIETVWNGRFLNWDAYWKTHVQITDRKEMRSKVARSIKEAARGVRKSKGTSRTIGIKSGTTTGGRSHSPIKRRKTAATTSAATNREVTRMSLPGCLDFGSASKVGFF